MARSKTPSPAPENTIEPAALRAQQQALALDSHPKRDRDSAAEGVVRGTRANGAAAEGPAPTKAPGAPPDSAPRDTTTVPEAVRDRFLQVGEKWFFPNGDPAFRDLGRKLTTRSENAEVVRSLVEIAHARGWDEIAVGGTKEFKRAVWHEAALQKIAVRGYTPTEIDEARLVRTMARRAELGRENGSPEAQPPEATEPAETPRSQEKGRKPRSSKQGSPRESATAGAPAPAAETSEAQKKVMYGTLVAHGAENYKLDPHEDMSYFVKLRTDNGREVVLWGKDLERALQESKSQPKVGDRVGVRHIGEKPVTVPKKERDAQGNVVREYDLSTHRNDWVVETEQFFQERAKLADIVRDPAVDAHRAVESNPELAGTYVALNGAQLVAQRRFADRHDQQRFVDTMRRTLAREIRRGDPLYVPALRDKPRTDERTAARQPGPPEISPLR